MKIYVDELPKNCDDCELGYFYDCQYCSLRPDLAREDIWVEKEKHCPLLSIKSLKQQVREEVVEEIKKRLAKQRTKMQDDTHCYLQSAVHWQDIVAILDQVKGESNFKD